MRIAVAVVALPVTNSAGLLIHQRQRLFAHVIHTRRARPIDAQDDDDNQIGDQKQPGGPPDALFLPGAGLVVGGDLGGLLGQHLSFR
jgi:hypothetical protein